MEPPAPGIGSFPRTLLTLRTPISPQVIRSTAAVLHRAKNL